MVLFKKIGQFWKGAKEPPTEIGPTAFCAGIAVAMGLACLVHLYWYGQGFYSLSWDESGRTLDAYDWLTHRSLLNASSPWLPFYRVVVGTGLHIHPDLFLTPRIISFIFGLISLCAVGWFAYELFHQNLVVLLTVAIGAFFSVRIALSLAPLSSIMFAALILGSMALLTRWVFLECDRYLLLGGFFLAISGTVRYEGWVFAGALLAVVITLKVLGKPTVRWWVIVLLCLMVVSFPVLWLSLSALQLGHPLGVLKGSSTLYPSIKTVLIRNPLLQFLATNTISLNIVGLVAVVYLVKGNPRLRILTAIPSIALLVISSILFLSRSAQSGPAWRMTGVWSMLLLPFTAYLILRVAKFQHRSKLKRLLTIGLSLLILSSFTVDTHRLKEESSWAFPKSDRVLGQYLDDMLVLDPKARVLIESSQFFHLNILVASQHPSSFVLNSIPEQPKAMEALLTPALPIDRALLESQNLTHLIFKTEPFTRWLDQNPEIEKAEDFEGWSVYRLAY